MRRFAADVDNAVAYLAYREVDERTVDFYSTFVPRSARGAGIASQLTQHALEYARQHGLRVVPSCPFVGVYLARHPEYQDLRV